MLVACFIWWASSSELLRASLQANLFSFIRAHLFSQRPWVPDSGLWSGNGVKFPQEWQTASRGKVKIPHWGGCLSRREPTASYDSNSCVPGNHIRWLLKSFHVHLQDSVCLNGGCQVNYVLSHSFIQQVFAECLFHASLYRKLWGYDGQ